MLTLVNNMLDVHKLESAEVQLNTASTGWKALVEEATAQVVSLLTEKNIQLQTAFKGEYTVKVDAEMMVRVLTNFLTNAIKYSPNNSRIFMTAGLAEGQLKVSIEDQGKGISADRIGYIFDDFYQADARKSGGVNSTGLGLTFCKLALNAHGSEIEVNSIVNEGTTFSFSLPLAKAAEEKVVAPVLASTESAFVIPEKARLYIMSQIPRLRALELYEAYEIEQVLESIRNKTQVDSWVNKVLDAAYSGNKAHYDQLLTQIEV